MSDSLGAPDSGTLLVIHRGTGTYFRVDDDVVILEAANMTGEELDELEATGDVPYSAAGRGTNLADVINYYCGGRKHSV